MNGQSLNVKVHSGSDLLFSCSKTLVDVSGQKNTAALVNSLKDVKTQVNQFLTELVVKSGSQEQSCGAQDAASDEEDEEDEEEEDESGGKVVSKDMVSPKRKADDCNRNIPNSLAREKRRKP